jgi:hypothetical protein
MEWKDGSFAGASVAPTEHRLDIAQALAICRSSPFNGRVVTPYVDRPSGDCVTCPCRLHQAHR